MINDVPKDLCIEAISYTPLFDDNSRYVPNFVMYIPPIGRRVSICVIVISPCRVYNMSLRTSRLEYQNWGCDSIVVTTVEKEKERMYHVFFCSFSPKILLLSLLFKEKNSLFHYARIKNDFR